MLEAVDGHLGVSRKRGPLRLVDVLLIHSATISRPILRQDEMAIPSLKKNNRRALDRFPSRKPGCPVPWLTFTQLSCLDEFTSAQIPMLFHLTFSSSQRVVVPWPYYDPLANANLLNSHDTWCSITRHLSVPTRRENQASKLPNRAKGWLIRFLKLQADKNG